MRPLRLLLFLLLVVSSALAQGMPSSPSRVDSWSSPHNQKRLRMQWEVLPPFKPTKLPDGSEEPPKAPWPMLIYVKDQDSKASEKLDEDVFGDARMVIASHAVKFIQLKPEKAIDVPWLRTVTGIKDPTLLLVDRDFKVVDVMNSPKEFSNSGKVLKAMDKVVKDTYETSLTSYVGAYFKLLKDGESLWKQEQKMEELRKKAADADKAKAEKYDKEADEIEADLKPAMSALADEEVAIQDSLVLKGSGVKEETPTTFGTGKERRKLTPAEIEALEAFKEFSRDQNPVVRAAAVEDLGAIDSAVMVDAILKAANDVDLRVIQAAGKGLGRMKSEESLSAMLAGLTDSNSKARHAALLGFAHLTKPYPAAMKPVSDMLRSSRDDEVRKAAIQALETMGDAKAAPELVEALDDSEESLRVMAATALGNLKATSAAPALIERVGASDWSLQKACIEALAKIRVKESIEPLLKAFEKEEGLLQEVLYKALVAITGQDFKYIAKNWRTWWDKYGSGFVVPTEAEIEEARKKAEKALEGYYDPRGKRKYHKIETLSRKMVFVIDISASMSDKIVIPPYAPEEIQQEFPERVKIEIAKPPRRHGAGGPRPPRRARAQRLLQHHHLRGPREDLAGQPRARVHAHRGDQVRQQAQGDGAAPGRPEGEQRRGAEDEHLRRADGGLRPAGRGDPQLEGAHAGRHDLLRHRRRAHDGRDHRRAEADQHGQRHEQGPRRDHPRDRLRQAGGGEAGPPRHEERRPGRRARLRPRWLTLDVRNRRNLLSQNDFKPSISASMP